RWRPGLVAMRMIVGHSRTRPQLPTSTPQTRWECPRRADNSRKKAHIVRANSLVASRSTDPPVRPRSELEPRGRAVAWDGRYPCRSDAGAGAELQRLCGEACSVGEGRMPASRRSAWRTALAPHTARV